MKPARPHDRILESIPKEEGKGATFHRKLVANRVVQWLLGFLDDDHITDQTFVFTRQVIEDQTRKVGQSFDMTKRFTDALVAALIAGVVTVPASPAAADTPNYHFINYHSSQCADVRDRSRSNKATLQQYHCHTGLNQLFRMTGDWWSDGYFLIISANSEKCLDVRGASRSDGAVIQQYDCHSGANQQWTITGGPIGGVPVPGNHWYTIRSRHSGKCLARLPQLNLDFNKDQIF